MKNDITNVLICGVGGQGIVLASKLLADAALNAGYDAKQSEVHGMSQRGGSVVSYVRFGKKINSPLINFGEADYILAFEKLESLRYLDYASPTAVFIIPDIEIPPSTVSSGSIKYPVDVSETIKKNGFSAKILDVSKIAAEIGNSKTVNTILLGALSRYLTITGDIWKKTFKEILPEKILDINNSAFSRGVSISI